MEASSDYWQMRHLEQHAQLTAPLLQLLQLPMMAMDHQYNWDLCADWDIPGDQEW
jgi:hypothetical protein